VLTGTPMSVATMSAIAAPVSAANPPTGCIWVIFDPIVDDAPSAGERAEPDRRYAPPESPRTG
jgi:hypothetical protein